MCLDIFLPKEYKESILEIDLSKIKEKGLEGIIVDLDNTITFWNDDKIPKEILEWLQYGKRLGLKFCIISNTANSKRSQKIMDQTSLPLVSKALKPRGYGFRQAMRLMGTSPQKTVAIGDQIYTDVLGANRLNLYSILVKPLSQKEFVLTKLVSRNLEKLIFAYFKRKGKFAPE